MSLELVTTSRYYTLTYTLKNYLYKFYKYSHKEDELEVQQLITSGETITDIQTLLNGVNKPTNRRYGLSINIDKTKITTVSKG